MDPSALPRSPAGVDVDRENDEWVASVSAGRTEAIARLHGLLVRIARAETRRRAPASGIGGPELDDIAQQAADDALLAITAKLGTFRGESRFTTWAYKFVVYEVGTKINRHRWHRDRSASGERDWDTVPARIGMQPEARAEWRELVAGIRRAVEAGLTDRQRTVFLALVVDGMPLDVLAERTHSSRNAIYKVMFDARHKIRAALVADGLIDNNGVEPSGEDAP